MERDESSSKTKPEERSLPHLWATSSWLDIHDEELLDQAPWDAELIHGFQSTLESRRGKEAGPAMESHLDRLCPSDSLVPRAPQPKQNNEYVSQGDPKGMPGPSKEPGSTDLRSSRSHFSKKYYARMEFENQQLRKQLADFKTALSSSQKLLEDSRARGAQLQGRLEEATATIFRWRPQRQEHTESEIQEEFDRLTESIKNWIEVNCDSFLEDDYHGFEIMLNRSRGGNPRVENILKRFQQPAQDLTELKEHIIAATIMRYLYDGILNRPLSILLQEKEEGLLQEIYKSMARMDPPKDLATMRTWKSDAATAIESHPGFASRYRAIESRHTKNLYLHLRSVLSRDHNIVDAMSSIDDGIVTPAIAFTRKIQSASSLWEFQYSELCDAQTGELMSKIPNFLAMIEDYRCINLSAHGKQLKPTTDLATLDQQRRLQYVLDIFPGLYCQRMTPSGFQPRTTVSQPVLIVSFTMGGSRQRIDADPVTLADGETSVPRFASLQSHSSTNTERRVVKDSQARPLAAPRFRGAVDRTATSSRRELDHPAGSQLSQYRQEAMTSRGRARESRRSPSPSYAPQDERIVWMLRRMWEWTQWGEE